MSKLLFCALLLLAGAALPAPRHARAAGFDGARREHLRAGFVACAGRREAAAAKPSSHDFRRRRR